MSTPNFKTTLHTVFGSCVCNKWACSLAVRLFSHRSLHSCRSKVCNAMASGRNMCHPASPRLLRKGKSGCVCAMEVVHIQEWNIMKHLERRRWGNKQIEESQNSMCEMYKIDVLRLFRRLGIVQPSIVCGICVCEALDVISIVWEIPLRHNESAAYIWQGESNSTLASSILLFLSMFYKWLKRLVSHSLKACPSQEMPRLFLYDMTKMNLVDIEASAYVIHVIPFCFRCYVCSKPQVLGALVQWPLPWHTWNQCS